MEKIKFWRLFTNLSVVTSALIVLSSCQATSPSDKNKKESRPDILFLLADDWSWPYASIYTESDDVIKTPNFDLIAKKGILFNNAFAAAPSCSPSRAAILTGQYPHRLEEAASLYGSFPKKFPVYTEILSKVGYKVGFTRKGWSPGNYEVSGWDHNPAGIRYLNFETFINELADDTPFCFWFGSTDPHRPYEKNSGIQSGMDPLKVHVPDFLPDNMVVRNDMLDYYTRIERFDKEAGEILEILKKSGRSGNTIIVISGDNGMPFPRAKATIYDGGTRVPLAISWGSKISKGRINDDFINLMDLAPTFLEAAGIKIPPEMTGHSLLPLLKSEEKTEITRDKVFLERERHSVTREGKEGYPSWSDSIENFLGVGYPSRAVRTKNYLYIRNLKPDRWPASSEDPFSGKPFQGADIDASPTLSFLLEKQKSIPFRYFYYTLAYDKRPYEELYDLKQDPCQLINVADRFEYNDTLQKYRTILNDWMINTNDPRTTENAKFDEYPYYGSIIKDIFK